VGIMGSVLASQYTSSLKDAVAGLPPPVRELADRGVGQALQAARGLGGAAGARLAEAARASYIDGMRVSLWVAAGLLATGAFVVQRFFPSHAEAHPAPQVVPEASDVDGPEVAVAAAAEA
jgi:MFS transporter, DHA2 family, multidrug resistance protein